MTVARVPVPLGERGYDIHVGPGLLAQAGVLVGPLLNRPMAAVVTDETVAGLHLDALRAGLGGIAVHPVVLPPGEARKSFAGLEQLCEALLAAGIERKDTVIALGGGVIGDLTGFATAVLRRGCRFIQIPTTLLAQVDSSVGGKTGINTRAGKNLVGAFHQPRLVLCDSDTLATLPPRERAAGYAEIVKYGLIDDPAFFDWLEANGARVLAGEADALRHAVATSCRAKAAVVAADEFETTGRRALLNLGHTFGHALEAEAGYSDRLLHGEAVALGMVLAFDFSVVQGLCPPADAARVRTHLAASGLPVDLRTLALGADGATLVRHMAQDKKMEAGSLTFILARGIGQAFTAPGVDLETVRAFLDRQLA